MQTELLSLNRSSLYYQPRPPSAEEVQIKHRINVGTPTSDGKVHGVAIIDGERVPVLKYDASDTHWYVDVGEIIR
jgi:hypothetical protein